MRKENGIMKLWNALAVCIFAYSSSVALAEEDSAEVGKLQPAVVTAAGEGLRETRSVVRGKAGNYKRAKNGEGPLLSSLAPTEDTIQQTNITGTEQKHRYRGRMFVLTTRQVSARSQKRAAGSQ